MQQNLIVPGLAENVHEADVAEVSVKAGDTIAEGDIILTLETDKAAMELPAEFGGKVTAVRVKAGDRVKEGDVIVVLETTASATPPPKEAAARRPRTGIGPPKPPAVPAAETEPHRSRRRCGAQSAAPASAAGRPAGDPPAPRPPRHRPHAAPRPQPRPRRAPQLRASTVRPDAPRHAVGPAFCARTGCRSGPGQPAAGARAASRRKTCRPSSSPSCRAARAAGGGLAPLPAIDFAQWGEVETVALSRIRQLTGENLGRSWPQVPQVTQHDEADITDLEAFRKARGKDAEARGTKLTVVALLLKACAGALKAFPDFNASLAADGKSLIVKRYIHIGVAVDTPNGLVVPVIRDVDRKGIIDLAAELARPERPRPRAQAQTRRNARRQLHHLQPGRHRRHRLHADRQLAGSGHPGRVARVHETGVGRRPRSRRA